MEVKKNLLYSEDHEWVRVEGNKAYIGISDYAQNALGSIVFVDLPEVDEEFSKGDVFGAVESVKAASDVYSPVSGKVIEVNEDLLDAPEKVNDDCYESWMICVELNDDEELDDLLKSDAYEELCAKEA